MSKTSHQRIGSVSNSHVGREFEIAASDFFESEGLMLDYNVKIAIGLKNIKKEHAFDLGCIYKNVLVECKSHKWTLPNENVPSAKLTVWNEAMYYFLLAPKEYRKIMFVLKDYSKKRKETLLQYYLRTYKHLIPDDVEFYEYDDSIGIATRIFPTSIDKTI